MVTKVEEKLINLRLTSDIESDDFAIIKTILNVHNNARVYQAKKPYRADKEWRISYTTKAKIGRDKKEHDVSIILAYELTKSRISKHKTETNVRWRYRQIQIDDGVRIKDFYQKDVGCIPDYKITYSRLYGLLGMGEEEVTKSFLGYETSLIKEAKSLSDRYIKAAERKAAREEKLKKELADLKEKLFKKHNVSSPGAEKLFEIVCADTINVSVIEKAFEQYVEVLKV